MTEENSAPQEENMKYYKLLHNVENHIIGSNGWKLQPGTKKLELIYI